MDLGVLRLYFSNLQSTLRNVADRLPENVHESIDATLTSRQQDFIVWLASGSSGQCYDFGASKAGLASSAAMKEWLEALELSVHRSPILDWCEEQGAKFLSELVEYREEIAAA